MAEASDTIPQSRQALGAGLAAMARIQRVVNFRLARRSDQPSVLQQATDNLRVEQTLGGEWSMSAEAVVDRLNAARARARVLGSDGGL